jgi:serine/threonine protein kinase
MTATQTPERERRLGEILAALVEARERGERPDRAAWLARYPEFAAELSEFFESAEQLDGVAAPLREAVTGRRPDELVGPSEPLGDFEIVREVGRGGMGVVYEAVQRSLGRRVALKVLPFAATLDPRQLQRFHNEARAAAGLHHTNIVPVHAVGSERGVHYYAMQFIEGRTLADFIAQQRGQAVAQVPTMAAAQAAAASATTVPPAAQATSAAPRDAAYLRRAAEWGIQAAEALDCAHTLGVVHRDVKPANLLLDGSGRLWVTDFGLAQVQSDARLTLTGDLVGTLRYMSPEQALARRVVIDHRTDIYSLGATLYELLTLRPAYGGNDRQELLRQIAFEEPTRLRRVSKAIPAELEIIVLKALEKNPADRYATAKELADDLRRWLGDHAIRARRPSLRQRAGRWVRRHRGLVGAAGAVLAVAALILAGSVGWVANDRATRRQLSAVEARKALDESADWLRRRRLPEALSAARRAVGVLPPGGQADPVVRAAAEARLADLELLTRFEDVLLQWISSNSAGWNLARKDELYGQFFRESGLDVDALSVAEAGERIRGRTAPVELAAALDEWYFVRRLQRVPGESARWKHLLQVARAADPDVWRTRLREALEREDGGDLVELASQDEAAHQLSPTVMRLFHALRFQGNLVEAMTLLRRAQRRHPDDFWINLELADLLRASGASGQKEAIAFVRVAVALRPECCRPHYTLGAALFDQGDWDGAIAEFQDALRLEEGSFVAQVGLRGAQHLAELEGRFPGILEGKALPKDADDCLDCALFLQLHRHQYAAAVRLYREGFAVQPALAEDPQAWHRYNAACAAALAGCGKAEDAAKLDDRERAGLRRQARDWLRADLTLWAKQVDGDLPKDRAAAQEALLHWLQDTDLVAVRGEDLDKLPEAERQEWRQLWADVAENLTRARAAAEKNFDKK